MPDARFAAQPRLVLLDQRDVGRGAAHIERQNIRQLGVLRDPHRARDPARRPRHEQIDRRRAALFGRHQPAVRAQQVELRLAAPFAQLPLHVADVARHRRPHGGIGDGGQRALIFLHFGQDVGRHTDRDVGQFLGDDFRHPTLMRVVEVGVDQAHGDSLDLLLGESSDALAQCRLVKRADNLPVRPDPLARLDRRFQRRHRLGLGPHDPCRQAAGNQAARDLQDVAIALGHDQPDAGDLLFQHGIGRDRRAVEEQGQFLRCDPGLLA